MSLLELKNVYVNDYLEKLFYFCLKKTGNANEAEDLASVFGPSGGIQKNDVRIKAVKDLIHVSRVQPAVPHRHILLPA